MALLAMTMHVHVGSTGNLGNISTKTRSGAKVSGIRRGQRQGILGWVGNRFQGAKFADEDSEAR